MVGNQYILERGQEGHRTEVSTEVKGIRIEMKGEMVKRDRQRGDRGMEHLLMMRGSRRPRAWTHEQR